MAYRRTNKYRTSRSRRHRGTNQYRNKNIMSESVSVIKSSSRRYMPKVKHGLENVGSNVTQTATKTVPFFQRMTRKIFGAFMPNKNTRRHY